MSNELDHPQTASARELPRGERWHQEPPLHRPRACPVCGCESRAIKNLGCLSCRPGDIA